MLCWESYFPNLHTDKVEIVDAPDTWFPMPWRPLMGVIFLAIIWNVTFCCVRTSDQSFEVCGKVT